VKEIGCEVKAASIWMKTRYNNRFVAVNFVTRTDTDQIETHPAIKIYIAAWSKFE
jgi:hypothetical protein